jgi:hypothetical protein
MDMKQFMEIYNKADEEQKKQIMAAMQAQGGLQL